MTTNGPTSLPPKNVTSNHLYLGLDKITDNIDHSKTRTENNGTTSYSVFL